MSCQLCLRLQCDILYSAFLINIYIQYSSPWMILHLIILWIMSGSCDYILFCVTLCLLGVTENRILGSYRGGGTFRPVASGKQLSCPSAFMVCLIFSRQTLEYNRSQWSCGLRRGSAAACLLGLWVRIPPGAWMSVSCECCVLSGRGLCDGLITRPEESYRMWCVW
jgi:hypothetical protein